VWPEKKGKDETIEKSFETAARGKVDENAGPWDE